MDRLKPYEHTIYLLLGETGKRYTAKEIVKLFKEGHKITDWFVKFNTSVKVVEKYCSLLHEKELIKNKVIDGKVYWFVEEYKTLEMELIDVFKKRDIKIEEIAVTEGATMYVIRVKRGSLQ